ncbi:MAG: hypothetical protein ACPHY7_00560 [Gammaproteobacteria bacterium]
MASTYSSDLKLELMATGENAGTWGTKTNTNLQLVQQAIGGYQEIDASSDVSLVMSNGSISNARNMVLEFTGTLTTDTTITIPDNIEKMYVLKDSTTHDGNTLTFKTVSEVTGINLQQDQSQIVYSDGTNINTVGSAIPSGTVMLFQQTAAPTGFTKITTHDNKALRVVNGSVTTGGTNSFTDALNASNDTSSTSVTISGSTSSHTLTLSQIPSHRHLAGGHSEFGTGDFVSAGTRNDGNAGGAKRFYTDYQGGGSGHSHGNGSLSGDSHNHTLNLDVEYVDIILASKD